jgi:hypothetical protein
MLRLKRAVGIVGEFLIPCAGRVVIYAIVVFNCVLKPIDWIVLECLL